MEFWVPFGYHVMAVYRFRRKEIMINYTDMGSLQPYVCVPMVPQRYPKLSGVKISYFYVVEFWVPLGYHVDTYIWLK